MSKDNVIRAARVAEDRAGRTDEPAVNRTPQGTELTKIQDHIMDAPISAAQTLADEAERKGGAFADDPDYKGAFGRTLFDDRGSEDGTVTVVFPAESIGDVPSQSLLRIVSKPDGLEYVASVTSGPFCEPDGLAAQAPQLIVTAVRGHVGLPRHHGRLQYPRAEDTQGAGPGAAPAAAELGGPPGRQRGCRGNFEPRWRHATGSPH